MLCQSLIEFIYGYVNIDRVICSQNPSIDLINLPIWLIVKSVLQINVACMMITYMCSNTRCHMRWIPFMWIVSFFYTTWTIVGMYLFFAQCFSNEHVGDGIFIVISIVAGMIFSNLNFRIIFYIGDEEIRDNDDGRRNLESFFTGSVIYGDNDIYY